MFKKSAVVGVSVTPEAGLEVAQIDYASKTVLKYGRKQLEYNSIRREITDVDLFQGSLQELLDDLDIQSGTELILTFPSVEFKVTDYQASYSSLEVENVIEEELYDYPLLKGLDSAFAYTLVDSTLQSNRFAYTALHKPALIETVMFLKDAGYKVNTIDTSIGSIMHALDYLNSVDIDPNTTWLMLLVDNTSCRLISMLGKKYLDTLEENISIGDILGDAENYGTVLSTVEPLLKNFPAKYLHIISKTNTISAEVLANKIEYSGDIIYTEANVFRKELDLNIAPSVDPSLVKSMSLDVIGASVYHEIAPKTKYNFNLFNRTLGEVYLNEQPLSLFDGKIVLSNGFLCNLFLIILAIVLITLLLVWLFLGKYVDSKQNDIQEKNNKITVIKQYLERHKELSTQDFSEGEETQKGLGRNKEIYSYYTIVGTEIPRKLWLTHIKLGDKTTIEGQADNIESVYSFFKNIKDYNPESKITLQKLGLASSGTTKLNDLDTESLLTTLNADYYEFRISDEPETAVEAIKDAGESLPGQLEVIKE